jgi:hypothetical protein
MARSGAGAGESSAVREASRGIEASDDAYPCPLCAKASGVTAVTGTRPCCACPGQRIASRRQDPGSHARWPRSWTRSGPPAPSGGSGPSIPPSSAPRPSPCAELWAGGPWGPPQDRPRKLTLAVLESSKLRRKFVSILDKMESSKYFEPLESRQMAQAV